MTSGRVAKGIFRCDLAIGRVANEEWFIEDLAGKNTARGTSFRREHPR